MKSIILLLTTIVSLSCFSQDIFFAKTVSLGVQKTNTDEWEWEADKKVFMKFTIHGNTVLVADKAKSSYRLVEGSMVERNDTEREQRIWEAKDEDDAVCYFKIVKKKNTGEVQIYVMYFSSGIAFCYGQVTE